LMDYEGHDESLSKSKQQRVVCESQCVAKKTENVTIQKEPVQEKIVSTSDKPLTRDDTLKVMLSDQNNPLLG